MELTAYRDGIFSNADPNQKFGADSLRPYSDGSLGFFGEGFTPWPDRSVASKASVVGILGAGAAAGWVLARALGAKPSFAAGSAVAGVGVAYLVGSAVAKGK